MNTDPKPTERNHPSQIPEKTGHELKDLPIDAIRTGERLLKLKESTVKELMESIPHQDLLSPIIVKAEGDEKYRLVAGMHRLEAYRRLGQESIRAIVTTASDRGCKLMEIDENLMRQELDQLERAQLLKARKELFEAKGGSICATPGGKQSIGFAKETAAKTGQSKSQINRSIRLAENIAEDVQEHLAGTPIAKSGVQLDTLARMPPDKQRKIVDRIKSGAAPSVREAQPDPARDPEEQEVERLKRRLRKASPTVRARIRAWLNEEAEQNAKGRV